MATRQKINNMQYELKPVTFYIATGAGEKWYYQEAKDAYKIVSEAIPEWIGLVLHRGQTPEKTPANWWTISCAKTGATFLKDMLAPVYEPEALVAVTLAHVRMWKQEEYQNLIREFRSSLKVLKYVGKKRLSDADKNSRPFLSLN